MIRLYNILCNKLIRNCWDIAYKCNILIHLISLEYTRIHNYHSRIVYKHPIKSY